MEADPPLSVTTAAGAGVDPLALKSLPCNDTSLAIASDVFPTEGPWSRFSDEVLDSPTTDATIYEAQGSLARQSDTTPKMSPAGLPLGGGNGNDTIARKSPLPASNNATLARIPSTSAIRIAGLPKHSSGSCDSVHGPAPTTTTASGSYTRAAPCTVPAAAPLLPDDCQPPLIHSATTLSTEITQMAREAFAYSEQIEAGIDGSSPPLQPPPPPPDVSRPSEILASQSDMLGVSMSSFGCLRRRTSGSPMQNDDAGGTERVAASLGCQVVDPLGTPWAVHRAGSVNVPAMATQYESASRRARQLASMGGEIGTEWTLTPAILEVENVEFVVRFEPALSRAPMIFELPAAKIHLHTPSTTEPQTIGQPFTLFIEGDDGNCCLLCVDELDLFLHVMKQANRLARQRTLAAAATQIQCAWRGVQCRRHLSLRSRATITFQRYARGYLARKASARRRAEGERRAYDAEQRARVIEELLETEASYVRNLDVLVRVYWRPLRSLASVKAIGSQITVESIATIFGNVDILHEKHSEWYDQLAKCLGVAQCDSDAIPATNDAEGPQAKRGSCSTLGEVFLEMLPWLDEYVPFCVNYPLSKAELDRCLKVPSFESYLSTVKGLKESQKNDLASFLIAPVQRIPRYELLIKTVIRHTDPNHPDLATLNRALLGIRQAAKKVNRAKKYNEAKPYLGSLATKMHKQYGSPGGTSPTDEKNYVSEGIATYLPVKNGASAKPVMAYLFLFIDQLVVTALKNLGRNASSASMSGGNGGGGASFFNVGSPGSQGVPKGAKLEFVTSVALDAAQALDWDELLAMAASPRSADESHGAGSNISGTESASAVVQSSGRPSLALDAGLARDRKRTGSQTSAQSSPGVPSAPMASPSSSPRRTPSDPLGANPPRREHMFVIVENLPGASAIGSPKKGPLAVPSSGHDVPAALTSICHRFTVETRDAKLHWLEDLSECREALDQRRDFSGLIRLGRGNSAVSTLTSLGLMTATGAGGSGAGHSPAGTVHGGGAASPSVLPTNRSGSLSRKSSLDRTKSHSGSIGPGSGGKAAAVLGTSDDDRVSQNIVRAAAKKSSRTYRSVGDLFGALGSSMASCGETETTTPSSSTQLDDVPEGHATTTATAACNASELDTVVGGSDGNLLSSVATSTGSNAAAVTLQADGGSGVSPKRTASFRLRAASSIRRRTRSPSPTSSTSGAGARSGTSMSHETVIVASSNADDDESDTDDLPSPGGLDARRMTAPHSRSSTLGDNGERVVHAPHRSGLGPGDDPSSSNSAQPGDAPRRRSDHTLDDRELPSSKSNGGMRGSGQHLKKSGHKQRSLGNLMASMFGNSNGGAASGGGS